MARRQRDRFCRWFHYKHLPPSNLRRRRKHFHDLAAHDGSGASSVGRKDGGTAEALGSEGLFRPMRETGDRRRAGAENGGALMADVKETALSVAKQAAIPCPQGAQRGRERRREGGRDPRGPEAWPLLRREGGCRGRADLRGGHLRPWVPLMKDALGPLPTKPKNGRQRRQRHDSTDACPREASREEVTTLGHGQRSPAEGTNPSFRTGTDMHPNMQTDRRRRDPVALPCLRPKYGQRCGECGPCRYRWPR